MPSTTVTVSQEDEEVAAILGYLGMFLALILFLVPSVTFKTIIKSKSTLEFDGTPYIFATLNCGLWVIYALPSVTPDRIQPLIINSIGLVLEFMYCVLFAIYSQGTSFKNNFGGSILFLIIIFIVVFVLFADTHDASAYLGILASALNIAMYGSPLSVMKRVWYSQSVEFMPLHLSLATFFCSFMWFLYGAFVMDFPIMFCNACGVILGIMQLCLYHRVSQYPNLSLIDFDKIAENRKHFSDVASGKEYSKLPGMDEIDEEQPDFNTIGGGTNPYESNNSMGDFDAI